MRRKRTRNLERTASREVRGNGTAVEAVATMLEALLGNEYVLTTKTRNYHWNVSGPLFGVLHKFFEKQYEELDEVVDEVAERIRMLEHRSPGTLREFLDLTALKENTEEWPDARGMISNLLLDHEAIVQELRQNVDLCQDRHGDQSTADFMIDVLRRHEKMAWMLRAQLSA